jgi:lysophospholipase L1-like esterase
MVPGFRRVVRTPSFACDVRTNALGMRDSEPAPPAPRTLRILGLGDSFALGVHAGALADCFLERLQAQLAAELRARPRSSAAGRIWEDADVANAGVDGYGTVQEIELLHRLDPLLHPDAVLLAFYLGNDFTDNSGRTRMTAVDGYLMLEASAAGYRERFRRPDRRLRLWLHTHSEMYLLLKERLWHPVRRAALRPGARAATRQPFDYYVYDSGFADCLQATVPPRLESGVHATRRALLDLRSWCATHGTCALVVALPAEQQVDPAARAAWIDRFGLDAATLDFAAPNRLLAALAAEAGLPLVDLTPGFAARIAGGEDLFLAGDSHWNPAGHAAAAEILREPILEYLLEGRTGLLGGR